MDNKNVQQNPSLEMYICGDKDAAIVILSNLSFKRHFDSFLKQYLLYEKFLGLNEECWSRSQVHYPKHYGLWKSDGY